MSYILLFIALFFTNTLALTNLDTTKNNVGICYSVWHSLGYPEGSPDPPDITEILHGRGQFAGQQQWHFWGRPAGGYYRTSQRHILRRHFQQISDAGIDFIVIDATNLNVRFLIRLLAQSNSSRATEITKRACSPALPTIS